MSPYGKHSVITLMRKRLFAFDVFMFSCLMSMMDKPRCKFTAEKISRSNQQLNCGRRQQDPYVLRSIRGCSTCISERSRCVLHLRERNTSRILKLCPLYSPPLYPVSLSSCQGPQWLRRLNTKCIRVRTPHLFNFPVISCRDCPVWCEIATKLPFKWEKSTPLRCRAKNITSLSNLSPSCDFTAVGPGLIALYILTFWPVN